MSLAISPPVPDSATSSVDLSLELCDPQQQAAVMLLWRTLEERLGSERLATSADWTECWLDHYGDLVPHQFMVARRGSDVCGVALITEGVRQQDGPVPVRTIHIGTAGEPDADSICVEYNDLLAVPDVKHAFAEAIGRRLKCIRGWDAAQADGFAPGVSKHWEEATGWTAVRKKAWYFDLKSARENGQEPYDIYDTSMQRQIRRKLKAADPADVEWAETLDQALEIFDELVELHQARWTSIGHPGSYASRRFREFHRDLIARLFPAGRIVLCRTRHAGRTLACSQLFVDQNRLLMYQGGWNPDQIRLSPGFVADYLCLCEAARRGFDAYDFLAGETDHKRRFSTDFNELVWFRYRRPKLKFAMLDWARQARRTGRALAARWRTSPDS